MINEGTGECSSHTEAIKSWPFRLKLTTDHIRWDSLKISPSQEFEDHILAKLDEASRNILDSWIPIEIHIIDVDIWETYKVNLAKKESFWFEPIPDIQQKKQKSCCHKLTVMEHCSYHMDKARKEYFYSLEPFKHIVKRRNLSCDQEIGLCWSGSRTKIKFDFSVICAPRLMLAKKRIYEAKTQYLLVHKRVVVSYCFWIGKNTMMMRL